MIDELEAIRQVGADDAHRDEAARDRVRDRVLGGTPAPRRRRFSVAGVALPAFAVAAGLALVAVVGGGDEDPRPRTTPGPAAAAPASGPPALFPDPDQAYYVRSRGQYLSCTVTGATQECALQQPQVREIWLSEDEKGRVAGDAELDRLQLFLGNRRFSHDELRDYAPTGASLLRELQDGRGESQGNGGASYPFVQAQDALREMPMPVAVRRAIGEMLPLIPGVTDRGETTDSVGRRAREYSRDLLGVRESLFLDPVALVMLEERTTALVADAQDSGAAAGDVIGRGVYLERAVVDDVGDPPQGAREAEPGPQKGAPVAADVGVSVLNGTSVAGASRRVVGPVSRAGYRIELVDDDVDPTRTVTDVAYREGSRDAALRVAELLGLGPDRVIPLAGAARRRGGRDADVVVRLGADLAK